MREYRITFRRMRRARPWVPGEMMKWRALLIPFNTDVPMRKLGFSLYGKVLAYSYGAP